jgi:hypothetical protein
MSAPELSAELADQLARVPASRDGLLHYAPCLVRLRSGEVLPRVYVVEEQAFLRMWGNDPKRRMLDLRDIATIQDSPVRLPARFANEIYDAHESGMGYFIFTLVLNDGRRLPFLTGNAVDFPNWPAGVGPGDVVSVEPHVGRDELSSTGSATRPADYLWCLHGVGE